MDLLQTTPIPHILIADDMATNRALLAFAFKSTNFKISEASTGEEVLELVKHQTFDCLLLDQLMPNLTGYETLIKLRENFSPLELPVIMVTALYDAKNIVTAFKNGANDYVTKPFEPIVILARVQLQLERRRTEIKLKIAKEEAEKANQAKSTFISAASHELKTPLNSILSFSQLLEMEFDDNKNVVDSTQKIISSSYHVLDIIDGLLNLAKIEAGKVELTINNFSISSVLSELTAYSQPLIAKNTNHLKVICADEIGEMQSDSYRLTQILFNLISNAAKFTVNGTISIIIDTFDEGRYLCFSVKDTGVGISQANQQKLFSNFFKAEESLHLNPQGTGLGLSLSLQLARLLGGNISVKSTLGEGSEFIVTLPRIVK
ncbi:MAG: response regulator [Methylococcaceae bacterium]|nr:response regulator [Methylococcaceae bacterium]